MNKMKKIGVLITMVFGGLLFFAPQAQAQQDAGYTQYMFNSLVHNPAYAGSRGIISTNALYRNQWVDIEGAPESITFQIHSPLRESNSAVGLWLENDEIGAHASTRIFATYAYHLPLGSGKLSLGLQGGLRNWRSNFSQIQGAENDPLLQEEINTWAPNVGVGAYYYTKMFYLGVGAPHILSNKLNESGTYEEETHIYATTGLVLPLGRSVKFKPTAQLKWVTDAPAELDLTAHFLLREVLWLGVALRTFDSVDFLIEYQFTNQLRAGYAYDLPTSDIREHTSGSHELMLGYDFCFNKSRIVTPRYF